MHVVNVLAVYQAMKLTLRMKMDLLQVQMQIVLDHVLVKRTMMSAVYVQVVHLIM